VITLHWFDKFDKDDWRIDKI